MSPDCHWLADEIGYDGAHCQLCHPENLIDVQLIDGTEVSICGPVARALFDKGLLVQAELKRFCCVSKNG